MPEASPTRRYGSRMMGRHRNSSFFFKVPKSTGSPVRFWVPTLTGLNTDEAVRVVSKRAILRHTHTSTHTHAHPHTGLSTRCDTSVEITRDRTLAGSLANASATTEPLARSRVLLCGLLTFLPCPCFKCKEPHALHTK